MLRLLVVGVHSRTGRWRSLSGTSSSPSWSHPPAEIFAFWADQ
jgi:hypothetical protein